MRGDFTRLTHRPSDGYVGVLMQQGRVTVDADWNEQVAIDRRRWRLQTIDVIGRACAPEEAPGFGIEPTPDGLDLVITPGRVYVEGHLVELDPGTTVAGTRLGPDQVEVADPAPDGRGLAAGQWIEVRDEAGASELVRISGTGGDADATLEVTGDLSGLGDDVTVRRVVTYLTQPFYPAAAGAPFADPFDPEAWGEQTHLVYLDVWERHVTATEDPRLREVALGGPDTATRIQLAWAVRLLRDPAERSPVTVGDAGCGASLDAWDALTATAAGRMSAGAAAPEDPLDPCVVPPEAGYRGLENRLYRVEIHDPGPLGTATFKWSRDNGTVLSGIRDFVPGVPFRVEVASLGRDRELRFRAGDVVEAESDVSELSGQAGTLAEVDGQPDEARRLVPLDTDVSAYEQHPRPRLRRWDHDGAPLVASDAWQELEDGVRVRFSGGPFRTGDWWVVPARTATGDVEGFIDSPPRGVAHHYARLALVTWLDPPAVEDCRSTFPTLCDLPEAGHRGCCTVSVGDGITSHGDVDSLREAVEALDDVDGPARICLLPGHHRVEGPVELRRSEVTIAGCGWQSPVASARGGVLVVLEAGDVRLERLALRSASADPTVLARHTSDLVVDECDVLNAGGDGAGGVSAGADSFTAGEVADEAVAGLAWLTAGPTSTTAGAGPAVVAEACWGVTVQRCRLLGWPALYFTGHGLATVDSLLRGGIVLDGGTDTVDIRDNLVVGGPGMGIQLGLGARRDARPDVEPGDALSGPAMTAAFEQGVAPLIASVRIRGNTIVEHSRGGVGTPVDLGGVTATEILGLTIEANRIADCGFEPLTDVIGIGGGVMLQHASDVSVERNVIVGNGPRGMGQGLALAGGVVVFDCHGLTVRDNVVRDNHAAGGPELLAMAAGIVGVMVAAGDSDDDDGAGGARFDRAATVTGNDVRVEGGPAVVLVGAGAMTVARNNLVGRYARRGLGLTFGRAVMVVNLGAAPDTGVAMGLWQYPSPLRYGPVQIDGNQIVVQDLGEALPGLPSGTDWREAQLAQLLRGSAVMAVTADDLSIQGNQVVNEVPGEQARIAASVWAVAATLRAGGNRLDERAGTAVFSYAGLGLAAHVASGNIATHCLRAEGFRQAVSDNIELLCFRLRPAEHVIHHIRV